jgi:hypothetical protein
MNKTTLHYYFIITFLLLFSLQACKNRGSQVVVPLQPETKIAENKITIKRYEQALFKLDKNQLRKGMASLYPDYAFFLGNQWQDTMNILRIYNFLNDPNIRELYDLSEKRYPDISFLENELTAAFDLYRQYYPEKPIPAGYTYISGLDVDNPVYFADTAMAIGLDIFLGSDVTAYQKAGLPKYKTQRFTRDFILPQCMLAVSDNIIKVDQKQNSLLDQMVTAGKALYFLDVILPDCKDEFKIGFSPDQLAWSKKNESEIWAFIIQNQLLFSSDPQGISKMMTDAPFTAGFAAESPGRLGAFIGWQIVREYMRESDGITLKQLMENTDSQQILKVSKYKPARG